MTDSSAKPAAHEIVAWIVAATVLILTLMIHLLPALLAGLLAYELVHILAPLLYRKLSSQRAKLFTVAALAVAVVVLLALAILGAVAFFRSDVGSLKVLLGKLAEIVDGARASLPAWAVEALPGNVDDLKNALVHWLRENATELRLFGKQAARAAAHILLGLILGAIVALREAVPAENYRPFARALAERATRLAESFRRIVFAQVRIAAINAGFTAIYLALVLPLFGVRLPLTKTMIAITFIAGLLPILGNLISNTLIVVVSLSNSLAVALASLVFLITIHKLEYFLNARIVGKQISARAWELLLAMLVMEAAFGLPGLVAAPIYYAYLKDELAERKLV